MRLAFVYLLLALPLFGCGNEHGTQHNEVVSSVTDSTAHSATIGKDALQEAVDRYSRALERHYDGYEYKEQRQLIRADFNQDGRAQGLALITIEGVGGGTIVIHQLVLFSYQNGSYQAGDSTTIPGAHKLSLINNNEIVVSTLNYGPDDARCCPTVQSQQHFRVESGRLATRD